MGITWELKKHPSSVEMRPERPDHQEGFWDRMSLQLIGICRKFQFRSFHSRRLVRQIEALGAGYAEFDDESLVLEISRVRQAMRFKGVTTVSVVHSFALIRELSSRQLGMIHYPSQLLGGLLLLQGCVAEMDTGEGKTLMATLPAATAALAGIPVHVISVNDYLTERDASGMAPLYRALGLNVGCIIHGLSPDEKRAQYAKDIVYATNKELAFDYLRDRLAVGEKNGAVSLQAEYLSDKSPRAKSLLMRGLHYAIVDEVDSVLIDEARTPLIISTAQGNEDQEAFYLQALDLAAKLNREAHFILDNAKRQIHLNREGKQLILDESEKLGPLWNGMVRRESIIHQALLALHLYHRDEHYLVRDDTVQIVDEFTGRVMPGRSWDQGLHQLIELKEGCPMSKQYETMAKISYQRFFRRYCHLCGMTGTAKEVAPELWNVYRLTCEKVPPHKPPRRSYLPMSLYPTREQKWQAVLARIKAMHAKGRPVLIGTRSVAVSELLSERCHAARLQHEVLNAKQDTAEAEIVKRAGKIGAVTIATNMAGRGTDIKLTATVEQLGGLHVISTERHEAARIDRQLAGRCGRQGDQGSYEEILSVEDDLLSRGKSRFYVHMLTFFLHNTSFWGKVLCRYWIYREQKKIERYHYRIRKDLFRQDQAMGNVLSFSGRLE